MDNTMHRSEVEAAAKWNTRVPVAVGEGDALQELLDRWAKPCSDDCEHSHCPLLRELWVMVENRNVVNALAKAHATVKPIIDAEKKGEDIGDLINLRLDARTQPSSTDAARRAAEEVANELFRIANGQRHVPFQRATIARAMELIITRHMAAVKVENEDAKV